MDSAGKGRPYTSEKGRAMQHILLKLVRSVVLAPEKVVVTQITAKPPAYKIQVAQQDFQSVLSKIHAIKSLALTLAGLPTGETLILYLDVI